MFRIFLIIFILTSCSHPVNYKTIDASSTVDGVHFTAIYEVIGSPDVHHSDTHSHTKYNFYNYIGYSSGSWQYSNAIYGIGTSYSCEISIKTTKNGYLNGMWMTGSNCPALFARIKIVADRYNQSKESKKWHRFIDSQHSY